MSSLGMVLGRAGVVPGRLVAILRTADQRPISAVRSVPRCGENGGVVELRVEVLGPVRVLRD
ncbi:hypothetical protein, partial [Cellulosimicrobium cellulans]|uniref:hypothetical protein n=1 Tax=Cellulosimicrobium cellulans TaxID=1710 RepID=UPI001D16F736